MTTTNVQKKIMQDFTFPSKMILFNGKVPQKGDKFDIDNHVSVGEKTSRIEGLYFRMFNGKLCPVLHFSYGYSNIIYALQYDITSRKYIYYKYDTASSEYKITTFDIYGEKLSYIINMSVKDIKVKVTGAFDKMLIMQNKLQVQYYEMDGKIHYDNVSFLKTKDWSISEFSAYTYLPKISGNYASLGEVIYLKQKDTENGTQLCTTTATPIQQETKVTDKVKHTKVSPQKRLNKLPNDIFSYDELYQSIEGDNIHRKKVIDGLIRSKHILKTDGDNNFIKAECFRLQKIQEPTLPLDVEESKESVSKIDSRRIYYKTLSRLNKLPDIFTLQDALNIDDNMTYDIVRAWKKYGYIKRNDENWNYEKIGNYRMNDGSISSSAIDAIKGEKDIIRNKNKYINTVPSNITIKRLKKLPNIFTKQNAYDISNINKNIIEGWVRNGYVHVQHNGTYKKTEEYIEKYEKLFENTESFASVLTIDRFNQLPDVFTMQDALGIDGITQPIVYNWKKCGYITYKDGYKTHYIKAEQYRNGRTQASVSKTPAQEPIKLQQPIVPVSKEPQQAKENLVELGEKIGLITVSIDIFTGDTKETRMKRLLDKYESYMKSFR